MGMQAKIYNLQSHMGRSMPKRRSFQDLTGTELERLSIEIIRLQDEYHKRMQTLQTAIAGLRGQCDELGEDADALAAEAHASTQSLR